MPPGRDCVRLKMLPGDAAVVCLTCVGAHVSDTQVAIREDRLENREDLTLSLPTDS